MEAVMIAFTKKGYELGTRIREELGNRAVSDSRGAESMEFRLVYKDAVLADVCRDAFGRAVPLVFIGAAGIAVRSISPFVRDKLSDPPVIVIDELGRFVIPLLSGHVGGANELAVKIAEAAAAVPVITTATDINEAFPVDLFAKENGLSIMNREGIARVSSAALEGRPVTLAVEGFPPKRHADVLISENLPSGHLRDSASIILCPKKYALGMGCRRGKSFDELRDFAQRVLDKGGIDRRDVGCIASIDIKKDEEGLKALSQAWRLPLITFDAELLARVPGEFSHSGLVLEKTGVDNVCERAAVLAAGAGAELRVNKTAENGMTAAVAARMTAADKLSGQNAEQGKYNVKMKDRKQGRITVVGMGPGTESMMTQQAIMALEQADVIVGYTVYLDLLGERFRNKRFLTTAMKQETERCRMCFDEASKGNDVAMVCSGDAGIYGMASLMFEMREELASKDGAEMSGSVEIDVVPGITAASSGAAVLGAPLNHDFCVISLSDLLTPWELIEKRLRAAAAGDFAIAIYNPSSKKRHDYLKKACDILLETAEPGRACGYVRSIGRDGEEYVTCTLEELRNSEVDMFTTVFIGNSQSRITGGRLITPRGYRL